MRLEQLDLIRYGAYADRSVVLPSGEHDLHVIVGPNEAGKSTLRCAISDLLFGIPARTPFAFLHSYDDLCIGAVIESAGTSSEVRRFKRNKQPLRAPDDKPLPENFFATLLGTATREFFERTFGLDHEQLVNGGLAILEAKDDVSRMLFQSASGLADFGHISDALTQEADQLWAPRASDNREYYRAQKRFQTATDQLKSFTIRSKDWKEAQRAVEEAGHAVAQADRRLLELAIARARLERVRRVAGPMAQQRAKRAERDALGPVVLLPKTADAELAKAEADLAGAQSLIEQFGALVVKTEGDQAAVPLDPTALQHEVEIERLAAECNRTRNHRGDIDKRTSELRVKQESVARIGRDLGFDVADSNALEARIPLQLLRSQITDLAQQYGALATKAETTSQQLNQKEREAAELGEELAKIQVVEADQGLLAARTQARSLGDAQKRTAELDTVVRGVRARRDTALLGVLPWTGSAEQLAALNVVDDAVAMDHQRKHTRLTARLEELNAQTQAAEHELQTKELEERQWQRARDPVTPEVLQSSREERNAIWGRIKGGAATPGAVAKEFEAKVDAADGVADRRYVGAQDVQQLESLRSAIETQRLEIALRRSQIEDTERERGALLEEWKLLVRTLALEGLSAERYPAWLQARQTAITAANQLAESQEAERRHAAQLSHAKEELSRTLADADVSPQTIAESGMAGLLALADRHVTGDEAGRKIHQSLSTQSAAAQRELKILQQAKATAADKLSQWNEQWSISVTQAGLASDVGVKGATQALESYARLATTLGEIREIQVNRIDAMQQDLKELAERAAGLVRAAGIAEERWSSEDVSLALSSRLNHARTGQKLSEQLAKTASEHRVKIGEATIQRDSTLARLRPLLERAGVETIEALREAVVRSSQARALDESIEDAECAIAQSGDAMAISALEAEVAAENLPEVAAKLESTLAEHKELQSERDQLLIEKRERERQFAQIHGQDDAAGAESDRQAAIAQMTGAIERYMTLRIGARMLRWAIDRYREERQDPLLKRAGQIFAAITLESYNGLTVDFDGDKPLLKGRRSNGKHVGVEALSSGTRDQLFLALRIAALEQHLDSGGKPLPFIADDLFINFDDQRTSAAFGVLSELATRTQVIYLTHHTHLASIATNRIGHGLHVADISDGVSSGGAQSAAI